MRVFMGRLEDGQQTGGHTCMNMTYERYVQDSYTDEHLVLALKGPEKIARRYASSTTIEFTQRGGVMVVPYYARRKWPPVAPRGR